QLSHLIHIVARLPLGDRPRENIARSGQRVHGARRHAALVALLSDDTKVPEFQMPAVAHEHIERGEIAVKRLPAVQLSEYFENAGDFAPRGGFRPSLSVAREKRAEI